jgi:hypothetical protein
VLSESVTRCAELLKPISVQVRAEILASPSLNTEETLVTLARTSNGGSRQARVWAYCH